MLWGLVYLFIISVLQPKSILDEKIPTGGDLASHYFSAVYLKDHLLPQGRLVGWQPGNYAGYPAFSMYFPLPFLVMTGLSLVMPLATAFKLVSIGGILLLPWAVSRLLRLMGCGRAAGDLGAVFSLFFLFMESNSAWGGNILSTLAGEFTYSIGLSLALVFLGRMHRDVGTGANRVVNALVLASVGLCHGYPLLFCVAVQTWFLGPVRDRWLSRWAYLLEVNLLAFGFMGFWIAPLLGFAPWTTPFNFVWTIHSVKEVLPEILWPSVLVAGLGLLGCLWPGTSGEDRSRAGFFLLWAGVAAACYWAGYRLGLVDVRFLPFGQLALVLLAAASAGRVVERLDFTSWAVLALALAAMAWAGKHTDVACSWARWNFSGWEEKRLWPAFKEITDELKGDFSEPRVAYEHGAVTNGAGTVRAFESLPFFSGRATLEGVYIQASLSAPYVFYIQSLISEEITCPLVQYNYGRLDLDRALPRLEMFNVGEFITVSETARRAAMEHPGFEAVKRAGPFSLFRLKDKPAGYVIQPRFRPVLVVTDQPRLDGYAWFRGENLDVPVVLSREKPRDAGHFAAVLDREEFTRVSADPPRRELPPNPALKALVRPEEITITGARMGQPLLIRVSFHPNWRVEGADRVWWAAPSFMMVFPRQCEVRIFWGRSGPDIIGFLLTAAACLYALRLFFLNRQDRDSDLTRYVNRRIKPALDPLGPWLRFLPALGGTAFLSAVLLLASSASDQDPVVWFGRGLRLFDAGQYEKARSVWSEGLDRFPGSVVADPSLHHLALTWFNQREYHKARETWTRLIESFPESRLLPEVLFHLAVCQRRTGSVEAARKTLNRLVHRFPQSPWTQRAREIP